MSVMPKDRVYVYDVRMGYEVLTWVRQLSPYLGFYERVSDVTLGGARAPSICR